MSERFRGGYSESRQPGRLDHSNPEIGGFESSPEWRIEVWRREPTEAQVRFIKLVSEVDASRSRQSMVERRSARLHAIITAREMNHTFADEGVIAMSRRLAKKSPYLATSVSRVLKLAQVTEAEMLINAIREVRGQNPK